MTTVHTTPSIWVSMKSINAAKSLSERIGSFADANVLSDPRLENSRVLHAVGQHASAWLVVDAGQSNVPDLLALAAQCSEANDCFRCLVVGAREEQSWPEKSIYLPAEALSSTILDRLRLESHALRITSRRHRNLAQVRHRI